MAHIFDLSGNKVKEIHLPKVFAHDYRPDLIKRAVLSMQSNSRQAYGTDVLAGKRTSARYKGVKDSENSMKNREMARAPRTLNSSPGQTLRARFEPQARSGREAHPPKVEKVWDKKMNKKERILAIMSAIAASSSFNLVSKKHRINEMELPLIIVDDIQSINKTKDLEKVLHALKLSKELERAENKKIRAGRGKMRGRRYKRKKSLLIIVSEDKGVAKSAKNIPGVDICTVNNLNAELLAPGAKAGRLTLWTESSIKKIGELYG